MNCWNIPDWLEREILIATADASIHKLRRKPIGKFAVEDLRITLGQNFSLPWRSNVSKPIPSRRATCILVIFYPQRLVVGRRKFRQRTMNFPASRPGSTMVANGRARGFRSKEKQPHVSKEVLVTNACGNSFEGLCCRFRAAIYYTAILLAILS